MNPGKRWSVILAAGWILLAGCGGAPQSPAPERCSSSNCADGCCQFANGNDPGTCVRDETASACGIGGGTCVACSDGKSCLSGTCDYAEEPYPQGAMFVFATAASYSGNLGGLSGADQKCQAAADSAGLDGTYKAWLSIYVESSSGDVIQNDPALDRITGYGPWYSTCRDAQKHVVKLFANRAALQGIPLEVIDCNEHGLPPEPTENSFVWTGTETGGAPKYGDAWSVNCSGWTSSHSGDSGLAGSNYARPDEWTQFSTENCSHTARLYCFQQ